MTLSTEDPRYIPDPLLHDGWVQDIARKFWGSRGVLDRDDILQAGRLGLVDACRRYDRSKGCTVSTHAIRWIQRYIRNAIIEGAHTVRLPTYLMDGRKNVTEQSRVFREMFCSRKWESSSALNDVESIKSDYLDDSQLDRIYWAIDHLDMRSQKILYRYFGLKGTPKLNLRPLAQHMGMSFERMMGLYKGAIESLRDLLSDGGDDGEL